MEEQNHKRYDYCLTKAEDLKVFCNPLFQATDIDYFTLVCINKKTHKRYFVTTKPEWLDHFYRNKFYNNNVVLGSERLGAFSFYIWSDFLKQAPFQQGRDQGIYNGISIISSSEDELLVYNFGSSKIKEGSYYVEGEVALRHFANAFNNQAVELLTDVEKHAFILPEDEKKLNESKSTNKQFDLLVDSIDMNRFHVHKNCYLTKMEALCLFLHIDGHSSKSAAKILNISHRTVEVHTSSVKQKFGNNKLIGVINYFIQGHKIVELRNYCEFILSRMCPEHFST